MSERLEHYVNSAPFDPYRVETMTPEMERYYMASQWRIMWWKFRRHRLAVDRGGTVGGQAAKLSAPGVAHTAQQVGVLRSRAFARQQHRWYFL